MSLFTQNSTKNQVCKRGNRSSASVELLGHNHGQPGHTPSLSMTVAHLRPSQLKKKKILLSTSVQHVLKSQDNNKFSGII